MRILLVGSGAVGGAIVRIADRRSFVEHMVVADLDPARAERGVAGLARPERFTTAQLDASDERALVELAAKHRVDAVINATDPRFVMPVFEAALAAGCHYVDMAMSLSRPHPERPFEAVGVMLGDEQFALASRWEEAGLLAIVGMGVEPGMSDVFARYASDHLFSEIDEIGVRDGADLVVEGYEFAPTFSIWTTIEECLNPPLVWEAERGWHTTHPFSEPEVFEFPEGIGAITCVNVEHEEVALVPRWIPCRRVTFKYGLGERFIEILRILHLLGLDRTEPVAVRGQMVAPRDVVAACLPDPAELGELMTGRTCAGTWVTGKGPDGSRREVYLYQVADNATSMREWGSQAVVWQTAVNPLAALELVAKGEWSGKGVLGPEAFPPEPFLDLLPSYGARAHMQDRSVPGAWTTTPLGRT